MTSDEGPDMIEELMWVRRPQNTHLSQSHTDPGSYSPLARSDDTNDLQGQATMRPADKEDLDTSEPVFFDDSPAEDPAGNLRAELAAALLMLGAVYAARQASPHIVRWWETRGREALRRVARRLMPKKRIEGGADSGAPTEMTSTASDIVIGVPIVDSAQASNAVEVYRSGMASEEARERFISALVAQAYADEQLRTLRSARIEDGAPSAHLAVPIDALTREQLASGIRHVLEAHPDWPNASMVDRLGEVLEQGPPVTMPKPKQVRLPQVSRSSSRRG
ncbi:hypothetical protein [Janibacter indicus]|uniref:hypothetical protein n=1 Tax=Janibacter indicus TaxID=857417 RepID=UPI003EB74191